MTGAGINEVNIPNLNTPASNNMIPAKNVANNTPWIPSVAAIDIKIAAIAPVGPEI